MVYSVELGYDPDEWEECAMPTHFLAFSAPVRIVLAFSTIVGAAIFFWLLNKTTSHLEHEAARQRKESIIKELKKFSVDYTNNNENPQHELSRFVEKIAKQKSTRCSPKRQNFKRPFTSDEQIALIDWERDVQRIANDRIREAACFSDGTDESLYHANDNDSTTFGVPLNAFENQSLFSEFSTPNDVQPKKILHQKPVEPARSNLEQIRESDLRRPESNDYIINKLSTITQDESILENKPISSNIATVTFSNIKNNDTKPLTTVISMEKEKYDEPNIDTINGMQSPSYAKNSSSSEEGFVKIDNSDDIIGAERHSANLVIRCDINTSMREKQFHLNVPPSPLSLNEWSDDIAAITQARPISIEVDDTTADEIEYVVKQKDVNSGNFSERIPHINTDNEGHNMLLTNTTLINSQTDIEATLLPTHEQKCENKTEADLKKEEEQMKKLLQEYDIPFSAAQQHNIQTLMEHVERDSNNTHEIISNIHSPSFDAIQQKLGSEQNSTQKIKKFFNDSSFMDKTTSDDKTPYDLLTEITEQQGHQNNNVQQQSTQFVNNANAFIIEEDMLESDKQIVHPANDIMMNYPETHINTLIRSPTLQQAVTSAESTSKLVLSNETFEKAEITQFDDVDDAITYAPEIQSEEIPPDQLSENENSLNLELNLSEQNEFDRPAIKSFVNCVNQNTKEVIDENEKNAMELCQKDRNDTKTDSKNIENRRNAASKISDKRSSLLKQAAPPELFALSNNVPISQNHAESSKSKKLPKFIRRNIGFFDDSDSTTTSTTTSKSMQKQSSLMSAIGVTSAQEALLKLTSLNELSDAMRRAGLESTNLIFGIDYTASNKYQGEKSFRGKSLHTISSLVENPYQKVIKIMGRTLAPFSNNRVGIPVYGFGDLTTSDWSVFPLSSSSDESCQNLDDVLRIYNEVTPNIDLSGPTNFAPLIYRAISICQKIQDYHILVIIADGQVTNERATRKAIVHACQYPLSIIVVGVGDGPWDMMRVFDESLPKRPWDNFHFVEFNEIISCYKENEDDDDDENEIDADSKELEFAIHSLLEIPDQYQYIRKMVLLPPSSTPLPNAQDEGAQTPLPPDESDDCHN